MGATTTGPHVMNTGAMVLLFAAFMFLGVRYVTPPYERFLNRYLRLPILHTRRWWKVWSYGLTGLVAIGGFIAVVVGAVMWATGTTAG